MTTVPKIVKYLRNWRNYFPIVLIIIIAIVLRLFFFNGLVRVDDFTYSELAYKLAKGAYQVGSINSASFRIGFYAPVALLYRIFGVNNTTTLIWPFLCSLLSVFYIYKIGELLINQSTGMIAALLWASFPTNILYATDLLSDGPMIAMMFGSIYFFLKSQQLNSKSRAINFFFCCILLIWSILIKPFALVLIILFASYWISLFIKEGIKEIDKKNIVKIFRIIAYILIILITIYLFGITRVYRNIGYFPIFHLLPFTAIDTFETIITKPEFSYIFPLVLISIIHFLNEKRINKFLLIWLIVFFVVVEWSSVNSNPLLYYPLNKFEDYRLYLIIFQPLLLISASYISRSSSRVSFSFLIFVLIICIFLPFVIYFTRFNLDIFGKLALSIFIIVGIFIPFIKSEFINKFLFFSFVLLLMLVSYDLTTYQMSIMGCRRSSFILYEDVSAFLKNSSVTQIALLPSQPRELTLLEYYSRFGVISKKTMNIQLISNPENGFILVSSEKIPEDTVKSNWIEVASFYKSKDVYCQRDINISIYKVN